MLRPLVVVLLEAAAAKAVKPVVLLLVEDAIFVLVGSVARPRGVTSNDNGSRLCAGGVIGGVFDVGSGRQPEFYCNFTSIAITQ
jgi:hypothetical protein